MKARNAILAALFAVATSAFGQANIPFSGAKLVDNSAGFVPLNGSVTITVTDGSDNAITYTPQGGSPTSAAFVDAVSGGVVQPLNGEVFQIVNPATVSPSPVYYRIQLKNAAGTTILTLPTVTIQGTSFSLDAYSRPPAAGVIASGIGRPIMACQAGAQYTDTTDTSGINWVCSRRISNGELVWTQSPSSYPPCANQSQASASAFGNPLYCLQATDVYAPAGYFYSSPPVGTQPGPIAIRPMTLIPTPAAGSNGDIQANCNGALCKAQAAQLVNAIGTTNFDAYGAAAAAQSASVQKANNLSDLASASTARTNLGLGALATFGTPSTGIPAWSGTGWGSSYAVGTAANDLVQLNASAQLPGLSGALLTSLNGSAIASGTVGTAFLPTATNSSLGILRPDGTSCQVNAGVLSCAGGGTGSGTVSSGSQYHFGIYAANGTTISSDPLLDDGGTNPNALTYTGTGGFIGASFKTTTGTVNAYLDLPSVGTLPAAPASSTVRFTVPNSVTAYTLVLPANAPSGSNTYLTCPSAVCAWGAGGSGSSSSFVTVTGADTAAASQGTFSFSSGEGFLKAYSSSTTAGANMVVVGCASDGTHCDYYWICTWSGLCSSGNPINAESFTTDVTALSGTAPAINVGAGGSTITLSGNTTPSGTVSGITSGMFTWFEICQPSSGGPYTWTWPSQIHGGGTIGTAAGTCSTQMFYSFSGSDLVAVSNMVTGVAP